MNSLDRTTQDNAKSSEHLAVNSKQMLNEAQKLSTMIKYFEVSSDSSLIILENEDKEKDVSKDKAQNWVNF